MSRPSSYANLLPEVNRSERICSGQWEIIEKIIDSKRKRWHSLRTICDAILWIVYTGSQWRNPESSYPHGAYTLRWQSVYYYFRKWQKTGLREQIPDALVVRERKRQSRQDTPSLLAVDSQTVKTVNFVSLDTGIDGAEKLNGRKRHLAVDTLGLPWATLETSAGVPDTAAGLELVDQMKGKVARLEKIAAGHGCKASFTDHVSNHCLWRVEIAQRPEPTRGFVPQKNRWQVERSFGRLNFRRRSAKDYEKTTDSSEAMLPIAFISFLLPRPAK